MQAPSQTPVPNPYAPSGPPVHQSSQASPHVQHILQEPEASLGGPAPGPFSHVEGLPIFPLLDLPPSVAIQKQLDLQNKLYQSSVHRKGVDIVGLAGAATHQYATNISVDQSLFNAVFTRYATPQDVACQQIIVDVLEVRGTAKWRGNSIRLRASRECGLIVRGKFKIWLKKDNMWGKNWNWKPVESVIVVEDGVEVPLGQVLRIQRGVASVERLEVWKQFEKEYKLPEI